MQEDTISITSRVSATNSEFLSAKNTGMGNVLFQISSVYGIAKSLGKKCSFLPLAEYCNKIKSLYNFDHGEKIFRKFLDYTTEMPEYKFQYIDHCNRLFNSEMIEIIKKSDHNLILQGYFENYNYFHDYKNDILNLLEIDPISKSTIDTLYGDTFNSYNVISVHYRAGHEFIKYHHKINYSFYKESLGYIIERVKNPYFLIFSDDVESIDRSIFEQYPYKIVDTGVDYIDLWTISLCHHHIMSPSTFCWWGVYLSKDTPDKIILYDKDVQHKIFSNNFVSVN